MTSRGDEKGKVEATEHDDIESPADASIIPPTHSSKQHLSAEPPRWRFVADAKKSAGYSSLAAGQYIQGKTSDELGAKYVAPDVSLYKAKREQLEVGKLQHELPVDKFSKDDVEVGKLKLNDETSSSRPNEIGADQLLATPKDGDEVSESLQADEYQKSSEEVVEDDAEDGAEDQVGEEVENEAKLDDASNGTQQNEEEALDNTATLVQNKEHQLYDKTDEQTAQENSYQNEKRSDSLDDEEMVERAKKSGPNRRSRFLYFLVILLLILVVVMGVLLGKKNNAAENSSSLNNAAITSDILASTRVANSTNGPSSYPSTPSSYPSTASTNKPSTTPSLAPSAECGAEAKTFSINHPHGTKIVSTTLDGSPHDATWILKNACSGKVIAQCRPCSLGSLSLGSLTLTSPRSYLSPQIGERKSIIPHHSKQKLKPTHRTTQMILQNMTECLPVNNEYVFEVKPVEASESCCGFDPSTFILSYDNVVIATETSHGAYDNNFNWQKTYFGESGTLCEADTESSTPSSIPSYGTSYIPSNIPSDIPSISPITNQPTQNPSFHPVTSRPTEFPSSVSPTVAPTQGPTVIPSSQLTTIRPTKTPVAFLGPCPDSYLAGSISSYTLGTQVESNGFVYQCISVSCRSYGLEPGRNWKVVGSCLNPLPPPTWSPSESPLRTPTQIPSRAPTGAPSASPSERPSSSPNKQPSSSPTAGPTKEVKPPTDNPSETPSGVPTRSPTMYPTDKPSASPSKRTTTPPTPQPSASPTKRPTGLPTRQPTKAPTSRPSLSPSTKPTTSPSRKPTVKPTKYPTDKPSSSPSNRPTASPSKEPTTKPSKYPTVKPTNAPSKKPTRQPSLPPRIVPTTKPTCSSDEKPYSMCFAVNMSGSICNGPFDNSCTECTTLPDRQDSVCRDDGVSWGSCCQNFADMKELAMVLAMVFGNLPGDNDFSVVQFASYARIVTELSSTGTAVVAIGSLTYTGGLDNHASGIEMCQQTLLSSSKSKKIILLVTDGEAGRPYDIPKGAAESAAESAKNDGVIIVPVLVSPDPPDTDENAITFLSQLSNDGEVFDFTGRGALSIGQVNDRLIGQISCY
mmetsp:Transcript_41802/g.87753  ORF Transcript_41802/g.87753 Transcript_41802/m.87753 type:complete len:1083 (+) Transcript_41802:251-3499(+)